MSVRILALPLFGVLGYLLYKVLHHKDNQWSFVKIPANSAALIATNTVGLQQNVSVSVPVYPKIPTFTDYLGGCDFKVVKTEYLSAKRTISRVLRYVDIAKRYSAIYGVPLPIILAVIGVESKGNPFAYKYESHIRDASRGLMQMLCRTAKELGLTEDCNALYNPDVSIRLGTKYLAKLYKRYGSWADAIAAYNAGRPIKYDKCTYRNNLYVRKVATWLKVLKEYGIR